MAIKISSFVPSPNKISKGKEVKIQCSCNIVNTNPPSDTVISYGIDSGNIIGSNSFNHSLNKSSNSTTDSIQVTSHGEGLVKLTATVCKSDGSGCDTASSFIAVEGISIHALVAFTDETGEPFLNSKWAAYRYLKENGFGYNASSRLWEI